MRDRAMVIRNPNARRSPSADRLREAARRSAPGWDIEVVETASAEALRHAVERAASEGVRVLLACGGDGTLNGVLNAVWRSGHAGLAVGVIPAGTANVWAVEAGIPRDLDDAFALLEASRTVEVDLGVARVGDRERAFLLMCGMGLDAAVVQRVEGLPRLKRWLAQGAFVAAGAGALRRQRPILCEVTRDGGTSRRSLVLAVAGNSRLYGGVARITSAAEMDDGLLDLVTFEARQGRRGLFDALRHLVLAVRRLRAGWHARPAPLVSYERADEFTLRPERPLPLQLDGEGWATCDAARPLALRVAPRALRVLVPARPNPLFASTRD